MELGKVVKSTIQNRERLIPAKLKLKNKEILEVKGYLGFSWVGKTVEWTKPD